MAKPIKTTNHSLHISHSIFPNHKHKSTFTLLFFQCDLTHRLCTFSFDSLVFTKINHLPKKTPENFYEMGIALFCYSRPIVICYVKKLSHVVYHDWPGIAIFM